MLLNFWYLKKNFLKAMDFQQKSSNDSNFSFRHKFSQVPNSQKIS